MTILQHFDENGNLVDTGFVADVGIPSQKHDRYISGVTDTWPGDDTFSVSFTQLEDVRRYRWRFRTTSGTVDYVKIVEDAVNEAQAEVWLTDASASASTDVEYRRLETSGEWSEWIELSKNPDDISLSRLDFLASGTTPVVDIDVEAE